MDTDFNRHPHQQDSLRLAPLSPPSTRKNNHSSFKTLLAFNLRCKMGPTKMNMKEKSIVMALISEGMSNSEIVRRLGRSYWLLRQESSRRAITYRGGCFLDITTAHMIFPIFFQFICCSFLHQSEPSQYFFPPYSSW